MGFLSKSFKTIVGIFEFEIDKNRRVKNRTIKMSKRIVGDEEALENNGVSTLFFVHELVAATWVPNPQNLPYVRHKNGNTLDNRADNLEWTSDSEAK